MTTIATLTGRWYLRGGTPVNIPGVMSGVISRDAIGRVVITDEHGDVWSVERYSNDGAYYLRAVLPSQSDYYFAPAARELSRVGLLD